MKNLAEWFESTLEALAKGASIDEVVRGLPKVQAEALRRDLLLAKKLQMYKDQWGPSVEFVRRTESILIPAEKPSRSVATSKPWGQAVRRWAFAVVFVCVLFFTSLSAASAATADALPGTSWYSTKLMTESIWLGLAFSSDWKSTLAIRFAERRISEASQLVEEERTDLLPLVLSRYSQLVELFDEQFADSMDQETRAMVYERIAKHLVVLERLEQHVPDTAQGAIQHAEVASIRGLAVVSTVMNEPQQPSHALEERREGIPGLENNWRRSNPSSNATHPPEITPISKYQNEGESTDSVHPVQTQKPARTASPTHTPRPTRTPKPTQTPKPDVPPGQNRKAAPPDPPKGKP